MEPPLRATDILDMAFDMGLQNPKIQSCSEWDGGTLHIITHGAMAYRTILEIKGPASKSEVERQLRTALVSTEAKKLDMSKMVAAAVGALQETFGHSPSPAQIIPPEKMAEALTEIEKMPPILNIAKPKPKPKAKRTSKAAI